MLRHIAAIAPALVATVLLYAGSATAQQTRSFSPPPTPPYKSPVTPPGDALIPSEYCQQMDSADMSTLILPG